MKTILLITATVGIAAFAAGCDDTTGTGGAGGTGSSTTGSNMTTTTGSMTTTGSNMSSTSSGMMNPPPPALGAQIDRFGRPAINTALNHAFDANMTTKDAAKDTWNGNGTLSNWVSSFSTEVQANLAIIDSLDSTMNASGCGNQLGADPMVGAGRYKTIGDTLAMDRLWINTAGTASTIYLGVEAKALGVLPSLSDGAGRSLSMDVIDQSYSILAAGDLTGSVKDGVGPDADTQGTEFPYLATPH